MTEDADTDVKEDFIGGSVVLMNPFFGQVLLEHARNALENEAILAISKTIGCLKYLE